MKRLPLILAAALLMAVLGACNRTPDMVLPYEPMARLMVDLELAEALAKERNLDGYTMDSSRLALRRSVLAKHGINEAVLDSSLRWYGAHLPQFLKVIDRADSILADSVRAFQDEESNARIIAAGDTAYIWPKAPSAVFARSEASTFLAFEILADSTWKFGDVFTLTFALDNARSPVSATLAADYANRNQSTEAVSRSLYPGDERHLELKLQLDSNMMAKRVYGYLRLSPQAEERAIVDSIRLMRTRLIHDDYIDSRRSLFRFNRNAK